MKKKAAIIMAFLLIVNIFAPGFDLQRVSAASVDTTAPYIKSTTPKQDAEEVKANTVIKINFNEKVLESVNFDGIVLRDEEDNEIDIEKTISSSTLSIKPTDGLLGSEKNYELMIPASSVEDAQGNQIESAYFLYFSTEIDDVAPTVKEISPKNNEKDTGIDGRILVKFSEPVVEGDFSKIFLREYANKKTKYALSASLLDDYTLEITLLNPDEKLKYETKYVLTIPEGTVCDLYENALEKDYSISFTTTNNEPPVVRYSNPTRNAGSVSNKNFLSIGFSKKIYESEGFGDIILVDQFGENVEFTTVIKDNVLTIKPVEYLLGGTMYVLTIPFDAIQDRGGTHIASDFVLGFKTAKDTSAPTISSTSPKNKVTKVATDSIITINFSEKILESANYSKIKLYDKFGNIVDITCELNGNIMTITPAYLDAETKYTVSLPTQCVKDMSGNNLKSTYTFSFTTE